MNSKEYLGKTVNVEIDRPMGSKHPKHGFIYPVNHGYTLSRFRAAHRAHP